MGLGSSTIPGFGVWLKDLEVGFTNLQILIKSVLTEFRDNIDAGLAG